MGSKLKNTDDDSEPVGVKREYVSFHIEMDVATFEKVAIAIKQYDKRLAETFADVFLKAMEETKSKKANQLKS